MGCCTCEPNKPKPVTEIVPHHERSCTDIFFLFLYLCAWLAVAVLFQRAVDLGGDPDRITKASDYLGRICGKSAGVENLPFGAWPYAPEWEFTICLADCSETATNNDMTFQYTSFRVAQWCIPKFNGSATVQIQLSGDFESTSQDASRAIGDLLTAWRVVLASAFVALIVSFLYIWCTERLAGCMVWTGILLMLLGGTLLSYTLFEFAAETKEKGGLENRAKALDAMGYVFAIGTILFLCAVFFLRQRIKIAIAVVKDAALALQDMRMLVCFPIFPFVVACGYIVWWISVALWLMSTGEEVSRPLESDSCVRGLAGFPTCLGSPDNTPSRFSNANLQNYTVREVNQELKRALSVHFFHLLWNMQFLIYFAYMVAAICVADWYFTDWEDLDARVKKRGEGKGELTNSPIRAAMWTTFRYHLGTLACGSLIIAIIQFIRAVVKYIEETTQGKNNNFLYKCLLRCIQCCLWCAECCMDKINKNAFIWVAIYGDSFGPACCSSFALVWRNLARVAAIHLVGGYLMLLGKVTVALLTAGTCGLYMVSDESLKERMSSVVFPCVVIFIVAFLVASMFMSVFETVIDTTFFCFLVDEECNGFVEDDNHEMLASKELRVLVQQFHGESEKLHNTEMKRSRTHREINQNRAPSSRNLNNNATVQM